MKLKKILASLTAAAMAVTTMAFAPASVSAAAVSTKPAGTEEFIADIQNYTASATGMWSDLGCANSDWSVDISSYMSDPNAYVKLVASVSEASGTNESGPFHYGISEFTSWAYPVKWYTDSYTVEFIGTADSTLDNFVSYVPLSDFKLIMSDGTPHASSMQANVQVGFAGSVSISEFSIVKFTVGDPVTPTADVPLGTLTGGGSTTIAEETWGLSGNNWTSNFYSDIAAKANTANYTSPVDYMNEFAGILYEVNVSSVSTPVKYGDMQAQTFAVGSTWISGNNNVDIENGTDKFYVYMDMSELSSTSTLSQVGIQLYDSVNFNTIGQTANISYSVSATLLLNAPTLSIPETLTLRKGESDTLTAETVPAALASAVKWSSDDDTVASVDSATGEVTATAKGDAVITADIKGVALSDTCAVSVADSVDSVTVTPATAEIYVGETAELTATVSPEGAAEVTWTTSDAKVATVKDGVVTAVAPGTATITANAGTKSDSCVVTVVKKTFAVSVSSNDETMGTASADVTEAAKGDTVTLTAEPKDGFRFVKWEATGVTLDADDITSENVMFTMPASEVSVIAYFEEIPAGEHAVNVKSVVGGTASASVKSAVAGTVVTLSFKTATGYEFDKWIVSPETVVITDNKFTMPDEAVTITPVFKKISYNVTVAKTANGTVTVDKTTAQMGDTVTVTATPDDGYALVSISVNGKAIEGSTFEMPAENVEITAVFERNAFNITAETVVGGVCSADKTIAKAGETITVTATPDAGYELVEITVNGIAITGNTFVMPAEDVVVSAVFKKLPGTADAVVETPEGITVEFEGSKEDVLAAVFGDDYSTLVANGAILDVVMTVKDESDVSEEDKVLVNGILTEDMNVGLYLNIELFKTVDGVITQLSSISKPISFKISVPAEIIDADRSYYAVRVHDGAASFISDAFNSSSNTISVSSDKFSTFAIVYEDKPEEIIEPEPEPVVLYSIVSDSHSSASAYKAAAGTVISVKTEFGFDAEVYCNGRRIAVISDNGTFIMPKGNVKIVSVDNGYIGAMRRALPNSYIFVYDSEMNYIKTNGSTRGINGTGKITVKLGSEYAGKTITLYKGRKSTEVKLASMILDEDGNATFTVSAGMNYTAVVE